MVKRERVMRKFVVDVVRNDTFKHAHCEQELLMFDEIGLKPEGFIVIETTVRNRSTIRIKKSHARDA